MVFSNEQFGQNIKELRLACGLTQKDLAKLLDVSIAQISDIEKGKSTTSLKRAVMLADFFKVSLDSLVGLEKITPKEKDELVEKIRNLPENYQQRVLGYIDSFS